MKTRRIIIFIFLLSGCILSAGQSKSDLEQFEEYISFRSKNGRYSGVTAIYKNDSLIFSSVDGYANIAWEVKNNFNTKFDLASVTKMFTATGIAILFEEGKINLNSPFMIYFPEFPVTEAKNITIKQLLSHTSGISDLFFLPDYLKSDRSRLRKLSDYDAFFNDLRIGNVPKDLISYSNTNYVILGRVIEKVTGIDYYSFINDTIFSRLGMKSSGFYEKDRVVPNLAEGYFKDAQASVEFGVPNDGEIRSNRALRAIKGMPAGGAYSNAADMQTFIQGLQNEKLIKKSTLNLFKKEHQGGYGLGMQTYTQNGLQVWGHSGGFYGASTMVFFVPEKKISFISLTNIDFAAQPVFDYFMRLLSGSNPLVPKTLAEKSLKTFEGFYEVISGDMKGRQIEIIAQRDKLIFDNNLEFFPIGENSFFDIDNPGFILEFSRDSDEKPSGFIRSEESGFKQEANRIKASEVKNLLALELADNVLEEFVVNFQFAEGGMMAGQRPSFSIEDGTLLVDNMMRFIPFEQDKFFLHDDVGMILHYIRDNQDKIIKVNVLSNGDVVGTLVPFTKAKISNQ